jgi:hypothetical protein
VTGPDVTLFRQSAESWPGTPTVHLLEKQQGFMLVSACHSVLADILAEKATVPRESLVKRRAQLVFRGYCRHCVDRLG